MVDVRVNNRTTDTRCLTYTNHLGSVVAVGNASGGIVTGSYAMYEPFGAFLLPPTATNPSVTDRGFTGHRQNNTGSYNLGLIYMNARYYHPQLGRFISPDSIVPDPANPQSYNRYSYVLNSPLNYIDPTGHRVCLDSDANGCTNIEPHEPVQPLSTSSTSPVPVQYDVTAWLAQEMVFNLGNPELQSTRLWMQTSHIDLSGFSLGMLQFYLLNSNNGIWNLKLEMNSELGDGVVLCGAKTCAWVDYSAPGNIHFGFVAAYANIPLGYMFAAGGLLESWDRYGQDISPAINPEWISTLFDNPGDFAAVVFGYLMYQRYGAELTPLQFQSELTVDVLNMFQPPPESFVPPGPAVPQPNKYPHGAFNNE